MQTLKYRLRKDIFFNNKFSFLKLWMKFFISTPRLINFNQWNIRFYKFHFCNLVLLVFKFPISLFLYDCPIDSNWTWTDVICTIHKTCEIIGKIQEKYEGNRTRKRRVVWMEKFLKAIFNVHISWIHWIHRFSDGSLCYFQISSASRKLINSYQSLINPSWIFYIVQIDEE